MEPPPPPSSQVLAVGYDDAVAMGSALVRTWEYHNEVWESPWAGQRWDTTFQAEPPLQRKELSRRIDAITRAMLKEHGRRQPASKEH